VAASISMIRQSQYSEVSNKNRTKKIWQTNISI